MSFTFRLDRLLRLRTQAEQARARDLATAALVEEQRRRAVQQAAERLDRISDQMKAVTGQVASAGTLRNLGLTVESVTREIDLAATSHAEASEARSAEEERFLAARRDRRVVERLREIRESAWREEANRLEQKDQDEIALRRHGNGTSS